MSTPAPAPAPHADPAPGPERRLSVRELVMLQDTVETISDRDWRRALVRALAAVDRSGSRYRLRWRGIREVVSVLGGALTIFGAVSGTALPAGVSLETGWILGWALIAGAMVALLLNGVLLLLATLAVDGEPPDVLVLGEALAQLPGEAWDCFRDSLGEHALANDAGDRLFDRSAPPASWGERLALLVVLARRGTEDLPRLLERAGPLGEFSSRRRDLALVFRAVERQCRERCERARGPLVCPGCRRPALPVTLGEPSHTDWELVPGWTPVHGTFVTCPDCLRSRTLVECPGGVVAVIGAPPEGGRALVDGELRIDPVHDELQLVYDRVRIAGADEHAIEALAIQVLNGDDAPHRETLRRARVEVPPGVELDAQARTLLERTFASVEPAVSAPALAGATSAAPTAQGCAGPPPGPTGRREPPPAQASGPARTRTTRRRRAPPSRHDARTGHVV